MKKWRPLPKILPRELCLSWFQGTFVRVFLIAQHPGAGNTASLLKMKNFVFRTSRTVGGATTPPLVPLPPG